MLQINNLSTYYNKIQALKSVSLNINENEIVTLIGANGAGKTTLLKTISGLLKPKDGEIIFKQKSQKLNLVNLAAHKIVKKGIIQVPEGRKIFANLTVKENLQIGAFSVKIKNNDQGKLEFIYSLFPILKERQNQLGGTLSGGEQQMLAIARALMSEPKLLMLDEPSMGLAPVLVEKIFAAILQIRKTKNLTILLVEQNAMLSLEIADRGYVLETGKIILQDNAKNLLQNEEVKKAYLGC